MSKQFIYLTLCITLCTANLIAQTKKPEVPSAKPKLIVGIVVDQMRNDYIYRFWDRYSSGGFKRLVTEGFYFKNTHYNYTPTYTGPGHASIYTGATPRAHGIIANDWFVKADQSHVNCVQDTSVKTIGSTSKNGRMSPKNEMSSTIGDELKINSNQSSKVFAIALKDRGAILPGGHSANGAFWFDDLNGKFITSSWYMNALPNWVDVFNAEKKADKYLEKGWNTLYNISTYTNSLSDSNRYEASPGKEKPIFPYEYTSFLSKNNYAIIKATPFGNSITKDLAIACIQNEKLGKNKSTDMLCISFSSTDYVGHSYGIRSIEIEDIYLRLDKDLEELLLLLDKEVGKGNYTIFLTADHGAAEVPNYLIDQKIPAGILTEKELIKQVKQHFVNLYKDSLLLASISNEQVFLNEKKIVDLKLSKEFIETELCNFLVGIKGIAEAYPSSVFKQQSFNDQDLRSLLQNGYNHKMSGNVCFVYEPAWIDHGAKGTTHGSGYVYDTHVPFILFGNGVKKGETFNYTTITQIAPSICELLKISRPNSTFAQPLNNYIR